MTEHLRKILGNKLALPQSETAQIPSPVDMIEKILIKGGVLRGGTATDVVLTEEAEDPEDQSKDAQKAAMVKAKNSEKREAVAQELSDVTFLSARRMPNFERAWEPKHPYPLAECISFNEGRLLRIMRTNAPQFGECVALLPGHVRR